MTFWNRLTRWFASADRIPASSDASESVADDFGKWVVLHVHHETMSADAIVRVRTERPSNDNLATFVHCVTIRWPYGGSGMPGDDVSRRMLDFERALDPLSCDNGFAYLVVVRMGLGEKRWIFYTSDSVRFTRTLTALLSAHERYPIETGIGVEPEWASWREVMALCENAVE